MTKPAARAIAFYLPQYHPIPENDEWWGKGFTEWTNVAKAKPLFPGHHQPNLPGELGFYDLRIPEVREQQAALAREAGIEGFCYWHYWFGNGRKILERPINEVIQSGKPDFPFCLCWANQSWSGIWHGAPNQLLIEQEYPGAPDYTAFFYDTLPAFRDSRYIRVNGKPLFLVYAPSEIPDLKVWVHTFRSLAEKEGFPGIHLVAYEANFDVKANGFDAKSPNLPGGYWGKIPLRKGLTPFVVRQYEYRLRWWRRSLLKHPRIYPYSHFVDNHYNEPFPNDTYPTVLPNWDNTPRSGSRGLVLKGATPQLFARHLRKAINAITAVNEEERIVFIKAWNEWAEGNYLEPDRLYDKDWIKAVASAIHSFKVHE